MLKLFQSFFGGQESRGAYPDTLIEAAIERAVDGTDARLRLLPGYRKRLREPVIHAIDQVVALVDAIVAPLAACRNGFSADPRLAALFVSAEQMLEQLGRDPVLRAFRGTSAERLTALLLAERVEKNVLGMDLAGGEVRRDVAQVTVGFRNHRLVDIADNEAETRRLLKRRAFDHLLTLALARIAELRAERSDLARQRDVLRHKLATLEAHGWSFAEAAAQADADPHDPAGLQAELDAIENQLQSLGADTAVLGKHLDIVVELLGQAEQQLHLETVCLRLDSMNIQRAADDPTARTSELQEIHNGRGRSSVLALVEVNPGELPPLENRLATAHRYL